MSGDWDVEGAALANEDDQPINPKQPRSPRKLTKDSGYETSAQCDPDYANSLSDWLSDEKAIDQAGIVKPRAILPDKKDPRDTRSIKGNDDGLEWHVRHRPLSFSQQEVTSECVKNHRQLRHSYSQREVSRHTRQASAESLANSSTDLKKSHATSVESVGAWSGNNPSVTKSTPHLVQGRIQRHSTSSSGLLQSEPDDSGVSMVTRRFKKGSVYDALASTSGLDFSPVVQLKTYNNRRDDSGPLMQASKPPEKPREKPAKPQVDKSPVSDSDATNFGDAAKNDSPVSSLNSIPPPATQEVKASTVAKLDKEGAKYLAAHEKYPSWPVVESEATSVSYRSHSWIGQTDYPKEKVGYSRPKKSHQYKIATNQLQPVLERAPDYISNKTPTDALCSPPDRNHNFRPPQKFLNSGSSTTGECNGKQQFDFEAFHTPCIPQCYEDKEYRIHSPPERDLPSIPSSKAPSEAPTNDSNGFLSRYEEVRHQAQYSVPLSTANKQRSPENSNRSSTPDTPFLDRLRFENALQMPPPPPVPMHPPVPPQLPEQRNDFELSSENGTWMGSMESSSHGGRGMPKWEGSYSDLSTLSTQLSNRSSLFDSGHSTMPESGRLSPQSSCDSTAPSLLLEGPTRAQVVARHGCHREIVAHSARVQQPERHGSESILYYATGSTVSSSRPNNEVKSPSKSVDGAAFCGSNISAEDSLYRSHASLTLSPSLSKSNVSDRENKPSKCPSRQDSRKSSNSYSSDDSYSRSRCPLGDDTSGSSSDVSNVTCVSMSNYKGSTKSSKSLDKTSPIRDLKPKPLDQSFPKYKPGFEPPKSKSMDETSRKFIFPEVDKRQRVSDPELKAIQKQAVMSFYQRMSLAESIKSDSKPLLHSPGADTEPPPPYEASPSRMKMPVPKLSLPPKNIKPLPLRPHQIPAKPELPVPENGLQNYHSKSVPNLMRQSLDLPTSHPIFKHTYKNGFSEFGDNAHNQHRIHKKQGSVLATDEIISWVHLPNVLEKKREARDSEKKREAAPSSESKDPPEDNGGCSSGMHYLKPHKSPRKVHLKEVHHSNETASVRVMTPDGVTLVQTNERKEEKSTAKGPHKRRPAPPPPPKQPPRRPPPPPPPVTPPPTEVVVVVDKAEDEKEALEKLEDLKIDVHGSGQLLSSARSTASSNQMLQGYAPPTSPPTSYNGEADGPASPELPLPPPPSAEGNEIMNACDEPLPPPPDPRDMDVQPRMLDSTSLIYPKNSYMSYRSERKIGRQGFDGKYRRSFHTSASSMDLTTFDSSFQDGKNVFSPSSWEQIHNIRQHGTTVIFHSDCLQPGSRLQRSSSQDCVPVEETANNGAAHISSIPSLQNSEKSSHSINVQCSETQDHHHQQSVPYQPPSQERVNFEIQTHTPNSPTDSRQNSHRTKGISPKSKISDDIVNCKTSDSHCSLSLDNGSLTDGDLSNSEADANVDLNQNSVKNNKSERANSQTLNGTDINNRINSATQTTDTPRLKRKYCKTKAELECEQLSLDFVHQYGDVNLKNLLVPAPNHKTMSDYLEGLLNIELEKNGLHARNNFSAKNQSCERDEKWTSGTEKYNSSLEAKVINDCAEVNDNQNVDNDLELKKKKDELIESIGKKLESLRDEQKSIRGEMIQNELLGKEIANKLQTLAKPNEMEKYLLHVEEMEKIVNLLLSLSGRLARAENIFKNMQDTHSPEEKKLLEAKRDKLREQHLDACRLKENIDKRSNYVSTFLHKYFSDKDYAEYDRYIKMKTKLIVDIREIDEKINLGEEQLAALSVVAHLWKSANS